MVTIEIYSMYILDVLVLNNTYYIYYDRPKKKSRKKIKPNRMKQIERRSNLEGKQFHDYPPCISEIANELKRTAYSQAMEKRA